MARIRSLVLGKPVPSATTGTGTVPGIEAWTEALAEQRAFAGNSSLLPSFAASQRAEALRWLSSPDAPLPRIKWCVSLYACHMFYTIHISITITTLFVSDFLVYLQTCYSIGYGMPPCVNAVSILFIFSLNESTPAYIDDLRMYLPSYR